MTKKYKYESIKIQEICKKILSGEIMVPKIQRALVWNEKQKNLLHDSIKKGLPIGVITMYADNDKLFIVDGLQRLTTICSFFLNVFRNESDEVIQTNFNSFKKDKEIEYSDEVMMKKFDNFEKNIFPEIKLFSKNYIVDPKEVCEELSKNIESFKKFISDKILKYIIEKINLKNEDLLKDGTASSLTTLFVNHLFANLWDSLGMDEYYIHYIILNSADKNDINTLFKRLNDGGTKLDSFDVNKFVMCSFYVELSDKKIEVQNFIKDKQAIIFKDIGIKTEVYSDITSYDIFYYIMYKSIEQSKDKIMFKIFMETKDKQNTLFHQYLLFNLIKCLIYKDEENNHKSKTDDFDNHAKLIQKKLNNYSEIENIIYLLTLSYKIFSSIYREMDDFGGNSTKFDFSKFWPEKSQLIAVIGNIFSKLIDNKEDFLIKNKEKKNIDKFVTEYKEVILNNILLLILENRYTSGSAKKAFEDILENKYLNKNTTTQKLIDKAIEIYNENLNDKDKRVKFSNKDSMFMGWFYLRFCDFKSFNNITFEYDHIIPKGPLKKREIYSKNNIFNLSIIDATKNKSKSNLIKKDYFYNEIIYLTIKDKIKERKNDNYKVIVNTIKEYDDLIETICTSDISQNNYNNFLKLRRKIIEFIALEKTGDC
ncbi:MAG: GmrSD restriction endonuclease domain-containing protein [Mycoplasma sp.]